MPPHFLPFNLFFTTSLSPACKIKNHPNVKFSLNRGSPFRWQRTDGHLAVLMDQNLPHLFKQKPPGQRLWLYPQRLGHLGPEPVLPNGVLGAGGLGLSAVGGAGVVDDAPGGRRKPANRCNVLCPGARRVSRWASSWARWNRAGGTRGTWVPSTTYQSSGGTAMVWCTL